MTRATFSAMIDTVAGNMVSYDMAGMGDDVSDILGDVMVSLKGKHDQ